MKVGTHWEKCLAPSTFCPVGVRCIEFHAVPGPEPRASRPKIMGRIVLRWPGRALYLVQGGQAGFSLVAGQVVVGAPGWAPDGPSHSAEARQDLRIGFSARRCFLSTTPLLPGHKRGFCFRENRQSEGGKKEMFLDLS